MPESLEQMSLSDNEDMANELARKQLIDAKEELSAHRDAFKKELEDKGVIKDGVFDYTQELAGMYETKLNDYEAILKEIELKLSDYEDLVNLVA